MRLIRGLWLDNYIFNPNTEGSFSPISKTHFIDISTNVDKFLRRK